MNSAINEALLVAGQLGLDLDDVRMIFPSLDNLDDEAVDRCLKHGQVLHRLNVSAKLYGIIESPQTAPKDLDSVSNWSGLNLAFFVSFHSVDFLILFHGRNYGTSLFSRFTRTSPSVLR